MIFSALNKFCVYYYDGLLQNRVQVRNFWKGKSSSFRFVAHVSSYLGFPKIEWLWGDWTQENFGSDAVVVFDSCASIKTLGIIAANNTDSRKILYLWNTYLGPISKVVEYAVKHGWEIWSFDEGDCKKYGFQYNPQFYPISLAEQMQHGARAKYDFLFVGYNKGRKEMLLPLVKAWNSCGLKSKIIIREWDKYGIFKRDSFEDCILTTYSETPYDEIIKLIQESKCIVDLVRKEQTGLTVRAMEALAFRKKLITNNSAIREYDFYHPNNIFIIGQDEDSDIVSFIDRPYSNIDRNIVDRYDTKHWIERFSV